LFTGIVEALGEVIKITSSGVQIESSVSFDDTKIGDSVAVNGICLTVTSIKDKYITFDVMNETFSRTSLASLKYGSFVNLERAMPLNGRFGGHIVSGHIDDIGKIAAIKQDGIAIWYTVKASRNITRYIVEKGSVALDGISLTVANVGNDTFSVSTIPHTQQTTTLQYKKIGDIINIENDIVSKYIEKFTNSPSSELTLDLLKAKGF
jgi:riboflavin synthase